MDIGFAPTEVERRGGKLKALEEQAKASGTALQEIAAKGEKLNTALVGGGAAGDIVIPVYIGGDMIDEIVVTAQQRMNLRRLTALWLQSWHLTGASAIRRSRREVFMRNEDY